MLSRIDFYCAFELLRPDKSNIFLKKPIELAACASAGRVHPHDVAASRSRDARGLAETADVNL
jgi:hypothetical protein